VLIAAPCAEVANELFRIPTSDLTASAAWLALVSFTIEVYFTFSAYADMAIGVGRLFGLKLEENFRWPYEATSIVEFWQRWHMGLTSWFREYVVNVPRARTQTRVARWAGPVVILLCAAWYGLTWGWLAWGLYHAMFYALEERTLIDPRRFPSALRHVYLVGIVVIGWVFVRTQTLTEAVLFFKALAGLNAAAHISRLPVSVGVWAVLLAGAIGSAPLARALRRWSVAIDGATTSAVMMLFATIVFVWRGLLLLLPGNHIVPTRGAS
jgi:alginate O-acetyltransferase complex protein AlgI